MQEALKSELRSSGNPAATLVDFSKYLPLKGKST